MRKIIGAAFVSLDGVMQAPGGPSEDPSGGFTEGGWQFKFPDAAGGEAIGDMLSGEFDRLRLLIYPLTLGTGKRLFGQGTPAEALTMVHHQVTPLGTIIADYEPTGALPQGDFAGPEPVTSEREQERQRRIAAGTW